MVNILLVCSAGMSTSMLVQKMKNAAEELGREVQIESSAEANFASIIKNYNIVLLAPQVRFNKEKVEEIAEPYKIPVEVIDTIDYGTMNGKKVLLFALEKSKTA